MEIEVIRVGTEIRIGETIPGIVTGIMIRDGALMWGSDGPLIPGHWYAEFDSQNNRVSQGRCITQPGGKWIWETENGLRYVLPEGHYIAKSGPY